MYKNLFKIFVLFIICFCHSVFNTSGQGRYEYVKQESGMFNDMANAIANDPAGNLYMTGSTETNTIHFFVSKYDQAGTLVWQYLSGGTSTSLTAGSNIALDAAGNVYVALYVYSPSIITIGNDTLPYGSHLLKLDNNGNVLWHKFICGTANGASAEASLKVTASGTIYLSGDFDTQMILDNDTVNAYGNFFYIDTYVAKLDSGGVCQWLRHGGTGDNDHSIGIGLDSYENVTLMAALDISSSCTYGSFSSPGVYRYAYVRYDSTGTVFKLATLVNINDSIQFTSFTQTLDGDVFALSSAIGQIELGNDSLNAPQNSCMITKIDTSGFPVSNFLACKSLYPPKSLQIYKIISDSQKNLYITGGFCDSMQIGYYYNRTPIFNGSFGFYLFKTDSAFNTKWCRYYCVNNYNSIYKYSIGLSIDVNDNLYFSCNSEGDVKIGVNFFTGTAFTDIYFGKLAPGFENSIHGKVYEDSNGNSHLDPYESTVSDVKILQLPDSIWFRTDINGNFFGELDSGFLELKYIVNPNEFMTQPYGNPSYAMYVGAPQVFPGFDFGYTKNTLSGLIYWDSNNNCLFDGSDQYRDGRIVEVNPGPVYCTSNAQGYYTTGLGAGSYQVTEVRPANPYILQNCSAYPYIYNVNIISTAQPVDSVDFADAIQLNITDVRITITGTPARFGFTTTYYLTLENMGSLTVSGAISLVHDNSLTYVNSTVPYDNYVSNIMTFNYNNLQRFEKRQIEIQFTVGANIGSAINSNVSVTPFSGDADTLNNTDVLAQTVMGAVDPNEKQVSQITMDTSEVNGGKYLTYTVYFQNTGIDTAFTVVIADTLDHNLQPNSFEVLASSHQVSMNMRGNGLLTFRFDNILLPDSNVNESRSHGFVKYRILPDYNLQPGSIISNTAHIYFDFNSPVATNTTTTIITLPVSTISVENNEWNVHVFPNPASAIINVQLNSEIKNGAIVISDLVGKTLREEKISSSTKPFVKQINLEGILPGVYFISVPDGQNQHRQKFIIR